MVQLSQDKKSKVPMWIITTTDSEGYHRQLNIAETDLRTLFNIWTNYN